MNQILQTSNNKKRKSGEPIDIKSIVRFFAIIMIIFGIVLIGEGSYAMINNSKEEANNTEPVVEITQQDDYIVIHVKHNKAIEKILYTWNNEQELVLQGRGRTDVTEAIDLPSGNNILHVTVVDTKGAQKKYEKKFIQNKTDTTKPEIEFVVEGNNIKVVAKDETEIAYMTYKWNEGQETKIEANVDSPKQIEERIPVTEGQSKLVITAVDKAGNIATETQEIKGATKPTIDVIQEGAYLVIKISDKDAVKKLEYTLNGQLYSTGDTLNQKEFVYKQVLKEGENEIIITAYNTSGLTETFHGRCPYQP